MEVCQFQIQCCIKHLDNNYSFFSQIVGFQYPSTKPIPKEACKIFYKEYVTI